MQSAAYFDDDNPEVGFIVTIPDFPEAVTQGETLAEAPTMAGDALAMPSGTQLSITRRFLRRGWWMDPGIEAFAVPALAVGEYAEG